MILRERIHVNATASQIWAILRDPGLLSQWNPHCVRCEAGEAMMHAGLRFKATMSFGRGPERQLDGEVIECEPDRILTLRFSGEALPRTDEYVDETYVLQPSNGGTKVLHEIDFSHSGLPWFLKAVLRVIQLVGRKEGKSPLEGLQELVEGSNCGRAGERRYD
jgi:uncharacterized protein YndB with AHSA1/START domain